MIKQLFKFLNQIFNLIIKKYSLYHLLLLFIMFLDWRKYIYKKQQSLFIFKFVKCTLSYQEFSWINQNIYNKQTKFKIFNE
jgi:hypothetical protein